MVALAPPPAGTVTAVHVVPPFADRHTPEAVAAPATVPYITIAPPLAAAPVMPEHPAAARGEAELGDAEPLPGGPVGGQPDHRAGLGGVTARHVGAGRKETEPVAVNVVILSPASSGKLRVTDPVTGVLAGPDGRRTDRDPAARAPGDQRGGLAGRRVALHGAELPGLAVVGRDVEPCPGDPGAGLPAHRHDRASGRRDLAERGLDAAAGQRGGAGEVRRGRARWRVSRVERRGSGPAPVVRACHHDHRDADGDRRHDRHRQARYPVAGPHGRREVPAEAGGEALFRRLVRRVAQPAQDAEVVLPVQAVAVPPPGAVPWSRPAVRRGPGPLLVRRFQRFARLS